MAGREGMAASSLVLNAVLKKVFERLASYARLSERIAIARGEAVRDSFAIRSPR